MAKSLQRRYIDGLLKVGAYRVDENTVLPVGQGADASTVLLMERMGNGPGARAVLAVRDPLQRAVTDLRAKGATDDLVHRQLQAGLRSAAIAYHRHASEEVRHASAEVDRIRRRHEERYTFSGAALLKLEEAKLRLSVMTLNELRAEGERYMVAPDGRPAVEVDLLSAKLREAGDPSMGEVVHQVASEHIYQAPWLLDPEALPHLKAVAKFADLVPGQVILEDAEGRMAQVRISDLIDLHEPLPPPEIVTEFALP